jgi:phospholipase C
MRSFVNLALVWAMMSNAIAIPEDANRKPPSPPDTTAQFSPAVLEALEALGRDPKDFRLPGSLPNPHLKVGTDTLPQIQNIIVFMLENHSFDNILGVLGRGDGLPLDHNGVPTPTNPGVNGTIQKMFPMPNTCQGNSGPSQEWSVSHNAYNNGSMDGFVVSGGPKGGSGPVAMGYFNRTHLPFTYSVADQFPIGDRYFCSLLGQTWTTRMYWIAATSRGVVNTGQEDSGIFCPAGTIFNIFDKYGISWGEYTDDTDPTYNTPDLFPSNDNVTTAKHLHTINDFYAQAAAGKLPTYSLVDMRGSVNSQEAPKNMALGEAQFAKVVEAVGNGPNWEESVILVNYDEHGGYYDHVAPPRALAPDSVEPIVPSGEYTYEGYTRYGFRVPFIFISPWAKKDYVSHVVHDHTSILAFIERKLNLPAMTYRDANANDMWDYLDQDALNERRPNFPSIKELHLPGDGNTTERRACATTGFGTIPAPTSVLTCVKRDWENQCLEWKSG